ncbi:hypothetical protein YB2330_001423 [Saitoella coloradoensis]
MTKFHLKTAKYGKDKVRFLKVVRDPADPKHQDVVEMTVQVLLEGDIEKSYTEADNSVVVPTDTVKNTVNILAKENPVTPPELFAAALANHFPTKYPHIHGTSVSIIVHRWTRLSIDGAEHPHSFLRDGEEKRLVTCSYKRGEAFHISSGISNLLVLKSTNSAFHGFHECDYTTLKPTNDRVFSTEVEATLIHQPYNTLPAISIAAKSIEAYYKRARKTTLKIFAEDDSASVQATMYKMCEDILTHCPGIEEVTYALPNKHYVAIDLGAFGLDNLTPGKQEVFLPLADPSGLITATVSRKP